MEFSMALQEVVARALHATPNDVTRWVRCVASIETVCLLVALVLFGVWTWKLHQGDKVSGEKWRQHVAPSRNRFLRAYCLAILCWVLFYGLMAASSVVIDKAHPPTAFLDKRLPHVNVFMNLMQNGTTFWLVVMYAALAAPGPKRRQTTNSGIHRSMLYKGWLLVLVVITGLEVLSAYQQHVVPNTMEARHAPFNLFSGVAQGLALFLVMGRLEEHVIWDHLYPERVQASGFWPGKRRALMLCGYAYAALQSTYPVLDQGEYYLFQPLIITGAFILKLLFFVLVVAIIHRENHGRPSALEQYLYETERFGAEDLQSYERSFMRRHVDPNFRRSSSESGYMGIDHSRISPYRRHFYGLPEDRDGLLVTDVYPGSPAMSAGIRPGDYITHIRERPIGPRTTLKSALEGTRKEEKVRVTYYRPSLDTTAVSQHMCTVELAAYADLPHQRTVRLSQPFLGLTVDHNHPDLGAVVHHTDRGGSELYLRAITRSSFGQTFRIPDIHGLKQVRAVLLPGEPLVLVGHDRRDPVRYGPLLPETTVPWKRDQDGELDMLPVDHPGPSNVLHPEHDLIRKHYADRFPEGAGTEYRAAKDASKGLPLGTNHTREGVIYAFDERLELLFEYYFVEGELERLKDWPIWRKVTAGKIHIFVGQKPDLPGNDGKEDVCRSRSGVFCTINLTRKEELA